MSQGILTGLLVAALVGAGSIAVQAQPPQGPPPGGGPGGPGGPMAMPPMNLTAHSLTPSIYWVEGGIGNTGFIVGDQGVIVIDTTMAPEGGKKLQAEVAKVTAKPINAVILTHGDMDHVGGLSSFPAGITIIAQAGLKKSMAEQVAAGRSRLTAEQLPNHAVDQRESLTLEGVKLELLHWAPAHTASDLVVSLPAEKIVFTGDIFVLDQPRALIHREQQGSSEGWVETAKGVAALKADRYVVGHGDVQSQQQIEQRVNLVVTEREKIKAMVAKGATLQEIQAEVGDPPPAAQTPGPGGPRFQDFSEVVYQELTEKK